MPAAAQTAPSPLRIKLSGPQFDIFRSQKARNLFFGGQGIGKTHLMGVLSQYLIGAFPRVIGLIAANTNKQLANATMKEVFEVWAKFGWTKWTPQNPDGQFVVGQNPPPHFTPHGYTFTSNDGKVFFKSGAVLMFASLENYTALEGITIGWAMLDETADTREEAVTHVVEARLRQRGMHVNLGPDKVTNPFVSATSSTAGSEVNPLYVFTKPAKEQWLIEYFKLEDHREEIMATVFSQTDYFFKEYGNKCVVCASTYHNQDNLPANYISDRLDGKSKDITDMLIYGCPFGKSGVEYYSSFTYQTHVKTCNWDSTLPLHVTFDFNVNPFMTLLVWQVATNVGGRTKLRCLREFCLQSPRNSIEATCRAFLQDFQGQTRAGVYYYGDATGKNSLPSDTVRNYYALVEAHLRPVLHNTSRRLLKQNPRHKSLANGSLGRRALVESLFRGVHGVDVEIDPSCKNTIADYEHIKEDANGAKLKEKKEINGIKCEKYGHTSDAGDAIMCYLWGDYAKDTNYDNN